MSLFNYAEMVKALAKPGQALVDGITADSAHMLHMAVGLSGESAELLRPVMAFAIGKEPLDRENLIEECGDIEFYLEGYRQGMEVSRGVIVTHLNYTEPAQRIPCITIYDYAVAMNVLAGEILDVTKKYTVYGKAFDLVQAIVNLAIYERYFYEFRRKANISRDETLDANMAKLAKRYTGLTYSDKAAQERADKPKGK